MKQTEIRFNLDGLEDIKEKIGKTYRTRVGIIGDKASKPHEGGITNATLGLIQMFGSLTRKIPARDFLLMPLMTKHREIMVSFGTTSMRAAFAAGDYRRMFAMLGVKAEEIIQQAFETKGFGRWAPNAPATIDRKGSSMPLINFGELRRAVSSDVVNQTGQAKVGNNPRVAP